MMNVKELFEYCIEKGMAADPRGAAVVKKQLKKEKEAYDDMKKDEKEYYDKERLWNPYADSRRRSELPKRLQAKQKKSGELSKRQKRKGKK